MLTKLTIRNFKRFGEVEVELGSPVVFIGPNNSGQDFRHAGARPVGCRTHAVEREAIRKEHTRETAGVTVNRHDLVAIPVPDANLLWRDLRVRDVAAGGWASTDQQHPHRSHRRGCVQRQLLEVWPGVRLRE